MSEDHPKDKPPDALRPSPGAPAQPPRPAPLAVRPGAQPPPGVSSTPPPVPHEVVTKRVGDPLIGAVLLDRVLILSPIARGGMGKVYLGEQTRMKRRCAVKVLDPGLAGRTDAAEFTRRFLLEASVTSKLTHPNVVTIFDYGEMSDGGCFIAMEYLEGRSVSAELKKAGRLTPERAIHIATQACRALREAHALGVVHRDVKPGNIFLVKRDEDDDFVKVLDFGLVVEASGAAMSEDREHAGAIMGSPRYMAPEQVQGTTVDARTDVYAIGATLYAMLTGRAPFERPTELATMLAQVSDAPPPIASIAPDAALPQGLEAVVMKCLAKRPEDRYASMEELVEALQLRPGAGRTPLAPRAHGDARAEASGSRVGRFVVGVVVLLGASVTVALLVRPELLRAKAMPAAAQAVAPIAPAAPKPTATLHVLTDPPGAKVKEEGETMCEATPCDIVYVGDGADAGFEHLIALMKPGYRLERKLVTVGAPSVTFKLTPAR
jgi:tRNA A-37 threonylcarbamoyl transferase component Bud32